MYPRGSEWRRWDLHVHTKNTKKNDQFTSITFDEFCITLFKKALANKIAVIGITDYFCIDNYLQVIDFVNRADQLSTFSEEEINQIRKILILPNIELRVLPSTDSGRIINIHCIFNPDYLGSLENDFFSALKCGDQLMNRAGLIKIGLNVDKNVTDDDEAYLLGINNFAVSPYELKKLKEGNKEFRDNVIIAVTNSNKDGASGLQKHYDLFENDKSSSLDAVRKIIYQMSDCIFSGNPKDIDYFSGKGVDDSELVKQKCGSLKACIHGSDAHTEDKLFSPDEDRYCWIKADPTFYGLKQVIYEPLPGDRVHIGQQKPDVKDKFKVIKKIKFTNSTDFPKEILLNSNLCSIIGSRSSGKSALLAYIADAIDTNQTREKKKYGPGEGYSWNKIDFTYEVYWDNDFGNDANQGKIVFIPQNYLYELSDNPDEIKNKISPVLFNKNPEIKNKHIKYEQSIREINEEIKKNIETWFEIKQSVIDLEAKLKDLGTKDAVTSEIGRIETEIQDIKVRYKIDPNELENLKELSENLSSIEKRITTIEDELLVIGIDQENTQYFGKSEITVTPAINSLPEKLQTILNEKISAYNIEITNQLNEIVISYHNEINQELIKLKIQQEDNKGQLSTLKEKKEKNEELDSLINKASELKLILEDIESYLSDETKEKMRLVDSCEKIQGLLQQRANLLPVFIEAVNSSDQSNIDKIKFAAEANIGATDLGIFRSKLDMRINSNFVNSNQLNIDSVRTNPTLFLEDIFSGSQKIKQDCNKLEVAIEGLNLAEKILYTAEMEGDIIGGFSEPTMTPGKRALFSLRLMLAESDDKWPLLIDQPEDDLDSRSIFNEIVPFLKEKKKERQIIMVSHNANLVIGADSEQIIVANRHGDDRQNEDKLQFNYFTGSIENQKEFDHQIAKIDVLKSQGIREHTCQILEGGEIAFEKRKNRYNIK